MMMNQSIQNITCQVENLEKVVNNKGVESLLRLIRINNWQQTVDFEYQVLLAFNIKSDICW